MRSLAFVFALGGALVTLSPAVASTIVHDTIPEFSSITLVQGLRLDSTPVAADRSVLANAFDNVATTSSLLTLGRGGSLTAKISPAGNLITGGRIDEGTGGTSGFPESAEVFLGLNEAAWVSIGVMRNGHAPNALGVTGQNPGIATWTTSFTSPINTFAFTVVSGTWNSIRLVDLPQLPSSIGARSQYDGFDIAELEVSSVAPPPVEVVPVPAALALFGSALFGLGLAMRRARRA